MKRILILLCFPLFFSCVNETQTNKIKIKDTNTNAGILFNFDVKNNVMGTANVKMNIRFNGSTQATLELLSVKW